MNKDSLVHFTKYNFWANTKITEFVLAAGETNANVELKSSFPTIRKTLLHIWDAETIWINRLQGKSLSDWPTKNFKGNMKEAFDGFLINSKSFIACAGEKTEQELSAPIIYKTLDGKEFSNTSSQIIMHCMNHSTFHRGQLITMLRNVGLEKFSSTDYITFCRLK